MNARRSAPRQHLSAAPDDSSPPDPPTPSQGSPTVDRSATRVGRIPVLGLAPVVDGGRWPAKSVTGEQVAITATVFREGHDAVGANAVLVDPDGREHSRPRMRLLTPGTDRYGCEVVPDREGVWTFRVEGWSDPYGTWEHDAVIKVAADVDTELMLAEGALVLERAASGVGDPGDQDVLRRAVAALRNPGLPTAERLAAGTGEHVHAVLGRSPLRDLVTASATYPLKVERELALYGSWYEFFPRSEGAYFDASQGRWVSGTLATAAERLPGVAAMGFDVAYLTPVHPIGTVNRKGRNNTLDPRPEDPGSPYAIGSAAGGHDALHPDLGTFEDFDAFVARARECGLEVALDLALQCAPDHPWVSEHPEWFTTRADGTIAYAENPPKKYQDIYPVNFDNDPDGIYAEVLRVVLHWVSHGVTLFRVDNPHTKPVEFWEWLIAEVNRDHPEVIFLAEAFTRPAMMHTLAKVGFQQSYTYFTWRNTKAELTQYLTELSTGTRAGGTADFFRPSFWPTTHDILTPYMQFGGPPAFKLRAVLAATMAPTWGIYAGYELCENVARPGAEEQIDNEKYEYRPRSWQQAEQEGRSLAPYLRRLNEIRRAHPSLQRLRGITFHRTDDDQLLCYSKRVPSAGSPTGKEDIVVVVVNLDPHATRESTVHLDMPSLGMDWHDRFAVHDLLTGATWHWGEHNYVRLDPHVEPAHVLHLGRP